MSTIKVTVMGASGYIGGEVVRLLLGHPHVELVSICANEQAGKRLDEVQPNLRGFCNISFSKEPAPADVTFLSLPHGEAMSVVPRLSGKVIDLSGDFRIADKAVFEKYYKIPHTAWSLQKEFAYGVPEINRGRIRESRYVAVGGCFATAAILSLWPLREIAQGTAIVSGATGSSGSGHKPGDKTHHPFRTNSFFAYEPFHHRHTPEIEQASGVKILFQPHSAPMVRGVFTTSMVTLSKPVDALEIFKKAYEREKFVRVGPGSANVKNVIYSNFVDIGVVSHENKTIVTCAIDNLVKGGAGQAVQCFNLMNNFEEGTGLLQAPALP